MDSRTTARLLTILASGSTGRRRDKGLPNRAGPVPSCYAQVVKSYRRRRIVGVNYRVVFGTMERVQQVLRRAAADQYGICGEANLDIRQRWRGGASGNTLCQGEEGYASS